MEQLLLQLLIWVWGHPAVLRDQSYQGLGDDVPGIEARLPTGKACASFMSYLPATKYFFVAYSEKKLEFDYFLGGLYFIGLEEGFRDYLLCPSVPYLDFPHSGQSDFVCPAHFGFFFFFFLYDEGSGQFHF